MDSYAGVAYENRPSVEDQGNTVLNTFKKIADEIVSGYADGSRVSWKKEQKYLLKRSRLQMFWIMLWQ